VPKLALDKLSGWEAFYEEGVWFAADLPRPASKALAGVL
jgi:hypothetical protein